MGKPITGVDTYIYGIDGVKVATAVSVNNEKFTDLRVYKQSSAKSMILQTPTGELKTGLFTLSGVDKNGIPLDITKTEEQLSNDLPKGTCCIIYDDGAGTAGAVVKFMMNKLILSTGEIVYHYAKTIIPQPIPTPPEPPITP